MLAFLFICGTQPQSGIQKKIFDEKLNLKMERTSWAELPQGQVMSPFSYGKLKTIHGII